MVLSSLPPARGEERWCGTLYQKLGSSRHRERTARRSDVGVACSLKCQLGLPLPPRGKRCRGTYHRKPDRKLVGTAWRAAVLHHKHRLHGHHLDAIATRRSRLDTAATLLDDEDGLHCSSARVALVLHHHATTCTASTPWGLVAIPILIPLPPLKLCLLDMAPALQGDADSHEKQNCS